MITLLDYAHTEFPNHTLEVWESDGWSPPTRRSTETSEQADLNKQADQADQTEQADQADQGGATRPSAAGPGGTGASPPDVVQHLSLREHTVVAHVVGSAAALALMDRLRADGWNDTAAVLVCPTPPTVVPHGDEDGESVTDLPTRRVVGAAALGGVVGAFLGGAAGFVIGDELATGLILGGFGAVIGAVVGAMLGGLGRHAGERAWSQPNVPGRTMAVVAAFTLDETAAAQVVSSMEACDEHDIRLLSATGSWRTPLT